MDHVLYLDDHIVGFSQAVAGGHHFSLKVWNVNHLHADLQAQRSGLKEKTHIQNIQKNKLFYLRHPLVLLYLGVAES